MEFPGAPEDPETISFIDPVWLQQWGLGPENVLDYFALSPFYEKSCNNEQCRMQGINPREGLKNLTGLEFMAEDLPEEPNFLPPGQVAPPGPAPRRLFVVKRQVRKSPSSVEVQAVYYIMEGIIYQTPTVRKLIQSRLRKFTHYMNKAFAEVSKLYELTPAGSYEWNWQKAAKALQERSTAGSASGSQAVEDTNAALRLSMDSMIMDLVERYVDNDSHREASGKKELEARGAKRKASGPLADTEGDESKGGTGKE